MPENITRIFVLIAIFCLSSLEARARSYTKEQLNELVNHGQYPPQEAVSQKDKKSMEYVTCLSIQKNMKDDVGLYYPTETVVSTNIMRIEKLWTNDGAVTITCSALDNSLLITVASYK